MNRNEVMYKHQFVAFQKSLSVIEKRIINRQKLYDYSAFVNSLKPGQLEFLKQRDSDIISAVKVLISLNHKTL